MGNLWYTASLLFLWSIERYPTPKQNAKIIWEIYDLQRLFSFYGPSSVLRSPVIFEQQPFPFFRIVFEANNFDISPFHVFEFFSKLLQSKPTQATIFMQFFDIGADSNSHFHSSSIESNWFELNWRRIGIFTVKQCAREAASLGAPGHSQIGGSLF